MLGRSAECDVRRARSRVFHGEACLQFGDIHFVGVNFWCQCGKGVFIRCNVAFVGFHFCFYVTQLFEVDRVTGLCAGRDVGDCLAIGIDTLTVDIGISAHFEFIT